MWTKSNPGQGPPLKSPSPQLLSNDTTFQLGDFYVSVFTFRHTLFKKSPVMPTKFLLHERKFQQCRDQETLKHIPALSWTKHPLVSDEEKGIVNAITGKTFRWSDYVAGTTSSMTLPDGSKLTALHLKMYSSTQVICEDTSINSHAKSTKYCLMKWLTNGVHHSTCTATNTCTQRFHQLEGGYMKITGCTTLTAGSLQSVRRPQLCHREWKESPLTTRS